MKLRKECEHGKYDEHVFVIVNGHYERCPGGVFLPDDTLDLEALAAALGRIDDGIDYADPEAQAIVEAARWVIDALSVREAE